MAMKLYSETDIENIAEAIRTNGGTLLPKEYTQVEYIESTGIQLIKVLNFRQTSAQDTDIILDLICLENIGLMGSNARLQIDFRNSDYVPLNERCIVRWHNGVQYLNKNEVVNSPYNSADGIGLFAFVGNNYFTKVKLYNAKIKIDNTLKYNLIPCYRNSDDEVGLYDLVNNVFYTNQGTGTFLKGGEVLPTFKVREMAGGINTLADTLKSYIPHTNTSGNPLSINSIPLKPKELYPVVGDSFQSLLPKEYTQVDYLQSDGNQYIDTGVYGDITDNIKFDMIIKNTASSELEQTFVGNKGSNGQGTLVLMLSGEGTSLRSWSGTGTTTIMRSPLSKNEKHKIQVTFYKTQRRTWIIDNGTLGDNPTARNNAIDTGKTFGLFSTRSYQIENPYLGQIYKFKIYKDDVLACDLIPCYRNSDNEVGMYDLVTNIFLENKGTGSFTYGSIVTPSPDNEIPINVVKSSDGVINYNISDGTNTKTISFNIGTTEFCKLPNGVADKLWVNLRTGQYRKTGNVSNKYTIPTGSTTITINDMKSNGSIISSIGGTVSGQTITFSGLSPENAYLYYELATPTSEVLGTLSKENLAKLVMYAGTNNISIDGYNNNGAEPVIEIDYYTQV